MSVKRSPFFALWLDEWRAARDEFERLRFAAYLRAEHETRGKLLNDRGRRAGIDPLSLFIGPTARAHAYASPELIEHWATYPRPMFSEYERQLSEESHHA